MSEADEKNRSGNASQANATNVPVHGGGQGDASETQNTPTESEPVRDHTKSASYVVVDLGLKAISALAIVLLGYAGWKLQRDSEASREVTAARERAERKYVPELRSISEVEVALLETSKEFDWPTFSDAESAHEARVGAHLTYLGSSLYFPDGEPAAYVVSAGDNLAKTVNGRPIKTTARCAVLFLGEFMRYAPLFRRFAVNRDARVIVRGQTILVVAPGAKAPLTVDVLDPRTADL